MELPSFADPPFACPPDEIEIVLDLPFPTSTNRLHVHRRAHVYRSKEYEVWIKDGRCRGAAQPANIRKAAHYRPVRRSRSCLKDLALPATATTAIKAVLRLAPKPRDHHRR